MIPKRHGKDGQYEVTVPTCLDRLIQQAIAQVLTPIFDPLFSGSSFGFRPGRSAHQAVQAAPAVHRATAWSGSRTSTWTGSSTGFSSMC